MRFIFSLTFSLFVLVSGQAQAKKVVCPSGQEGGELRLTQVGSDGGFAYASYDFMYTTIAAFASAGDLHFSIYENGVALGPKVTSHNTVRNTGLGSWNFGSGELRFSTSDNSNPTTNGRTYSYCLDILSSETAPFIGKAVGYANVDGLTNGGQGGKTVTVTTYNDLKWAAKAPIPLIIKINAKLTSTYSINVESNKTILGVNGASLNGFGLIINGKQNVIVKNLIINKVLGGDCISIKGASHHVWIDHNELFNDRISTDWEVYDEPIDITNGSDYVTVSWNYIHDAYKGILISGGPLDEGDYRVTINHNFFYNISERHPKVGFGTVHNFNNYHVNGSYAAGAVNGAIIRTDNNFFENIDDPLRTVFTGEDPGYISGAETNIFANSGDNDVNTSPSTWIPEYPYHSVLIPAAMVPSVVTFGAGPQ